MYIPNGIRDRIQYIPIALAHFAFSEHSQQQSHVLIGGSHAMLSNTFLSFSQVSSDIVYVHKECFLLQLEFLIQLILFLYLLCIHSPVNIQVKSREEQVEKLKFSKQKFLSTIVIPSEQLKEVEVV
jgi:hypothetical protein